MAKNPNSLHKKCLKIQIYWTKVAKPQNYCIRNGQKIKFTALKWPKNQIHCLKMAKKSTLLHKMAKNPLCFINWQKKNSLIKMAQKCNLLYENLHFLAQILRDAKSSLSKWRHIDSPYITSFYFLINFAKSISIQVKKVSLKCQGLFQNFQFFRRAYDGKFARFGSSLFKHCKSGL